MRNRWWRTAAHACRDADVAWRELRAGPLAAVAAALTDDELRHLRHTVFRINAIMLLYAHLRGTGHDTRRGVLFGAVTHLLDYAYDRGGYPPDVLREIELAVLVPVPAPADDPVRVALVELASAAWTRVADATTVRTRIQEMISTQRRSRAQQDGTPLTSDDLSALTRDKGHHSLCLYFAAVHPGFGAEESAALVSFGTYMQYMDDLEDLYEDRLDGRRSPVPGPVRGAVRATLLFLGALPAVHRYYRSEGCHYRMLLGWLGLFHAGILFACATREITRRLPAPVQLGLDRAQERLADAVPFFHVAPRGVVGLTAAGVTGR